jgi:hypothetical protein
VWQSGVNRQLSVIMVTYRVLTGSFLYGTMDSIWRL